MKGVNVKLNDKELSVLQTVLGQHCNEYKKVPEWSSLVRPLYDKVMEARQEIADHTALELEREAESVL